MHEAGGWFGCVVRETNSLPKLSIALHFPWERDAKLDAFTRGIALTAGQGAAGLGPRLPGGE